MLNTPLLSLSLSLSLSLFDFSIYSLFFLIRPLCIPLFIILLSPPFSLSLETSQFWHLSNHFFRNQFCLFATFCILFEFQEFKCWQTHQFYKASYIFGLFHKSGLFSFSISNRRIKRHLAGLIKCLFNPSGKFNLLSGFKCGYRDENINRKRMF